MKNALAYARVSTKEQAERGLSIPAQIFKSPVNNLRVEAQKQFKEQALEDELLREEWSY